MKVIALEEHFMSAAVNEEYTKIFSEHASPAARIRAAFVANYIEKDNSLLEVGEKRLSYMDRSGVDIQVIGYGNNNPMELPAVHAIPLCRQANDELAAHIAKNPERFYGMASLPVADPKAAAEELDRAVKELGFKGAILNGTYNGRFFDDEEFFPIFEKAAELDVPVYFHPGEINEQVAGYYYSGSWSDSVASILANQGFGWHVDSGIHVIRMILSGIFDKLPDLTIISGHWGELVPYFLERLDRQLPPGLTGLKQEFSKYYREHVYVTPSGMLYNAPFRLCLSELGADRILWAGDYPYLRPENAREYLESADISQEDKEKIAYINAARLLKL
ncbi:MAG: amidohydrolase family protein [Lacrimispora sp.]|uniref:amidohydrolase family protein n=1 Tax=Lacrimispora sp. TaxID=2719234 RepID=UPI0039E320F6